MELPEQIVISGTAFTKIKKRFYMNVSVYGSSDQMVFMRLGDAIHIEREYSHHKTLEKYGYPVAKVLEKGEWREFAYYIEESQGDELLSFVLHKDKTVYGQLSTETFERFSDLVIAYVEGQVQTKNTHEHSFDLLDETCKDMSTEMPSLKEKVQLAKEKYIQHFCEQPFVFSHGDFNTHNLFWKGVIDVEGFSWMPFGYDVMTMLFNGLFFPAAEKFEMRRLFTFSLEERSRMVSMVDAIATNHGLPLWKEYVDHHLLLRTLWAAKGMDHTPILQEWRFVLSEKVLDAYLAGESVVDVVDEYTV